jgi:aminopeptidase YwaD
MSLLSRRRAIRSSVPLGVAWGFMAALGVPGCAAPPAPVAPDASAAPSASSVPIPPPLRPLTLEEERLEADLKSECGALTELGPRSLAHSWNLHSATDDLARKLEVLGYPVARQGFPVGDEILQNLEVIVPGTKTSETLVIVAHYDTTAESPGANASASGSAALLELAKELVGKRYSRGLRLVWLSNESGGDGLTGSAAYAARVQRERLPVVATLTLGSLGNYSLEYGSQRYPDELLFGSEQRTPFGNFVAVLSNARSNPLLEHVRPALSAASLPVEELVLPEGAPLAADGPQSRFWEAGLAGLVLTDTAQFRSPFHEGASDTLDKVDFDRLTRVTRLLSSLVASLAEGGELSSPATPDAVLPAAVNPAAPTPGDLLPALPPLEPPG